MPGRSKKAFEKNVSTEINSGKPKDQALAIAYSVKRKKKKMAEGGMAYKNDSAKTESRPMPSERDNDAHEVKLSDHMQSLKQSNWTDNPTVKQAQNRPRLQPIKHPRMVHSDVLSARLMRDEDFLQSSAAPAQPEEQPPQADNEEGPDRHGPDVPALHMKKMAKGGMINEEISMHEAEEDHEQHPAGLESDNDEMKPRDAEIMSDHMQLLAEGGMAEQEMDHEDSLAAAIMAKKERQSRLDSDSDEDRMVMMALGGEILEEGGDIHSHGSTDTHESADQADLSRNADEDANEEDQLSFDALRKENYSESAGLNQLDQPSDSNEHGDPRERSQEDEHDMVSSIRRKMAMKRQFPTR